MRDILINTLIKLGRRQDDINLIAGSIMIAATVPIGVEIDAWSKGRPSWFNEHPAIVHKVEQPVRPRVASNCVDTSQPVEPK